MIDIIKGSITYVTASVLAIGSLVIAYVAWSQPVTAGSRDIAVLFGVVGLVLGNVLGFLFGSETATRTSRATERATAAGASQAQGTTLTPLVRTIEPVAPPEPVTPDAPVDAEA